MGTARQWAVSDLLQSTTGKFYGGSGPGDNQWPCNPCGTIVEFGVGLQPFVAMDRYLGRVGETGGILGQGFTEVKSVQLNGKSAEFKIVSDTFIEATVPPGATSGFVIVETPKGTLKSNLPFRVMP
jgi:hypothetical protein